MTDAASPTTTAMSAPTGRGSRASTSSSSSAIELDDDLPGAGPGRGDVAGERERAAAEVQGVRSG